MKLRIAIHEMRREQHFEADGKELVIGEPVLGLSRNALSARHDHRLVGEALSVDGTEDDETVVVAANGSVGAVPAGVTSGAVAVVAADLAALFAVATEAGPVVGYA
jgi:hypothetical protein